MKECDARVAGHGCVLRDRLAGGALAMLEARNSPWSQLGSARWLRAHGTAAGVATLVLAACAADGAMDLSHRDRTSTHAGAQAGASGTAGGGTAGGGGSLGSGNAAPNGGSSA